MKLEVGMYVRTKKRTLQCSQIARIRNMSKDSGYKNQYLIELDKNLIPSYEYHIYEEDIENAKHSLIELVKVGDYVNGYLVNEVYNPTGNEVFRIEIERDTLQGHIISDNSQIKSIVTKEQFEAMQYEIK